MSSHQPAVQGVSVMPQAATQEEKIDLAGMVADLNRLLRLKTTVIGMKMFARAEDMAAIPKIPRPPAGYTTDHNVHIAPTLGSPVGTTVGAPAGADTWGRALKTGEPSLSLPCYAERRYGGVPDEEMLMALSPAHLAKAIAGMKALAKNGLRYPIAPYGIQSDVRAGMGVSYCKK